MNSAARVAIRANVWCYRLTGGRLGGRGMGRLPVLLLTVPGRKTGKPRTVPVVYFKHDGGFLVVGTGLGGAGRTPPWFLNLTAAGSAQAQIGRQTSTVTAHILTDAEREQVWPQVAASAPHFARWQEKITRPFPLALLTTAN